MFLAILKWMNNSQKWTTYWFLSMQIWGSRWTVFPTILFESIVSSQRAETTLTFIAGNLTIPVCQSGIIITVKCEYEFRNLFEIENKMYLITLKSEGPLAPHLSKYPGFDSGSQAVGDTPSCFHVDRRHSHCWQDRCSENPLGTSRSPNLSVLPFFLPHEVFSSAKTRALLPADHISSPVSTCWKFFQSSKCLLVAQETSVCFWVRVVVSVRQPIHIVLFTT